MTDVVLLFNENRPGLIGDAASVAEERQEAPSKNTIDEMDAAIDSRESKMSVCGHGRRKGAGGPYPPGL